MASSGTAIITDNISFVKSRCNWLFETMNSNPRLVTVGGTITSQIQVLGDCQSYIYRKYYPTSFLLQEANALIVFMYISVRCTLLAFSKTESTRYIYDIQFVSQHRINRAHVTPSRRRRFNIASLIKQIILTVL